jgi:hypothetical protein
VLTKQAVERRVAWDPRLDDLYLRAEQHIGAARRHGCFGPRARRRERREREGQSEGQGRLPPHLGGSLAGRRRPAK